MNQVKVCKSKSDVLECIRSLQLFRIDPTITTLNLESMKHIYDVTMQIDSYFHYVCTGNSIGDEGAKGLGEALKLNTTLTTLDLTSTKH